MGRTACTEPQYLYKGALYLLVQPRTDRVIYPDIPSMYTLVRQCNVQISFFI